ncbi:hypothetical protein [Terrisporobacter sp.]
MYKKILIGFLLFLTLFFLGCEINDLNNNKNTTKFATSDIKQLIGITYDDIEKIYGSPLRSTYYINKNDLLKIQKNYVSVRSFNYYSIIKAYYKTTMKDEYIILWYKNNKVAKILFDEKDILNENCLYEEINNMDFKIDYFKNSSYLESNSNLKKFKSYINSNISDFNKMYDLNCPQVAANLLNTNKILYFYNISKSNNNYDDECIFIVVNNNKIVELSIIKFTFICETILNYIK